MAEKSCAECRFYVILTTEVIYYYRRKARWRDAAVPEAGEQRRVCGPSLQINIVKGLKGNAGSNSMSSPSQVRDDCRQRFFFCCFFLMFWAAEIFKISISEIPACLRFGSRRSGSWEATLEKKLEGNNVPFSLNYSPSDAVIGVNWLTLCTGETVQNWWRFSNKWALNSGVALKNKKLSTSRFYFCFRKFSGSHKTKYHSTLCDKWVQTWFSRNPSTPPPTQQRGAVERPNGERRQQIWSQPADPRRDCE